MSASHSPLERLGLWCGEMETCAEGEWVRYYDHLAALKAETEKREEAERDRNEAECRPLPEELEAVLSRLTQLRTAVEAEEKRLVREAHASPHDDALELRSDTCSEIADRLSALLGEQG